jgi:23S rRNA pseudouridine2605 synthase
MAQERLQKVMAQAGVASRRAAEELILKGRVRVNGVIVVTLGTKVDPRSDKVEVDGRRLVAESPLYLMLHKPRGVVSTVHDPEGRPTVRELLASVSERVFPVGRLDYHTSGALLLTNDGEFCDALIHPKRDVPKTYIVKVQGDMREADRLQWEEGVTIDGQKTRPAEVFIHRHEQGKTWIEVTLFEGRNQQIRKMGEVTGFPVMRLARIAFAGITTEGLRPGEYRSLVREELSALRERFGVPRRLPKQGTPTATNVARGPAPRVRKAGSAPAAAGDWRLEATADRGPERGGRGDRGPSRGAAREERGASRGPERGLREERGPSRGAAREERGESRGSARGRREERGASRGAAREERGASRGPERGRREERGPSRGAAREERGESRGSARADRGPSRGPERVERRANRGPGAGANGASRSSERGANRGPERGSPARGPERRLTGRARPSTRKNGG